MTVCWGMLAVPGLYQGLNALGSIKHYWGVLRLEGKKRLQIQSPISVRLMALVLVQEDKHEESRGSQHGISWLHEAARNLSFPLEAAPGSDFQGP